VLSTADLPSDEDVSVEVRPLTIPEKLFSKQDSMGFAIKKEEGLLCRLDNFLVDLESPELLLVFVSCMLVSFFFVGCCSHLILIRKFILNTSDKTQWLLVSCLVLVYRILVKKCATAVIKSLVGFLLRNKGLIILFLAMLKLIAIYFFVVGF
jgi:hypothetical protein